VIFIIFTQIKEFFSCFSYSVKTIIECLKYSCTGEAPPNSAKGQAFLHDPKVAGEREVKAQIKMRFRSVNGKPIVCTRSMQVIQKATKLEFKSLESALQTYNQNNEVSMSFIQISHL
jgi:DNA repair exonuclease SbcCD ATPase subunit